MLVRIFLFLLIGLGVAGMGGAVFFATHKDHPQTIAAAAPKPPAKVEVVVAARDVRAGNLLLPDDLTSAEVDASLVPPGASRDDPGARAALRGAMVRHSLQKGQVILSNEVLSPGDRGFLAAVLAPGARAVTVGVDSVSGTAGLIWPGDRVDLILTQTIDEQNQPLPHRIAGETVLQDVRVIAVDQQLVEGEQPAGPLGAASQNRTVTLEVSPLDAERVAVATRLGRLALVVRSAGDPATRSDPGLARLTNSQPDPVQLVWGGDVSSALRAQPGNKAGAAVRLFRGSQDAVEFKF